MDRHRFTEPYQWLVVALGLIACVFSVYQLPLAHLDWHFLLLVVVTICISSRFTIQIPRLSGQITVGDTLIFLTMLLYGGEAATLLAAVEGFCSAMHNYKRTITLLFNPALMAVSTFITGWILRLSFGPLTDLPHGEFSRTFVIAICIMAFAQYIANTSLAAVASACKINQGVWDTWKKYYLWASVTYLAGASAAGIIARLVSSVGFYATIVTIPIVAIVYLTYRTYLKSIEASAAQAEQAERHVEELSRYISELKKAEEALRASEERYRLLFECNPHPLWVYDTETLAFLAVNEAAIQHYGYSREEFLAMTIKDIRPPEDIPILLDNISTVSTGLQRSGTWRHKKKDGTIIDVEITSHTLSFAGRRAELVLAHDITERKRAEEERNRLLLREQEARREAEAANRMKDEFLAVISHELRTPLTAILGWTHMLSTGKYDEATAARALEVIERNAKSQTQLIDDLLDVSRIVSGKLRLDVRLVELVPLIKAAIDSVRPAAEAKEIRLQTIFDPLVGPISGDPNRLQQIVWNLLSNAIKFTPKGGQIDVRLERIGSNAQITVSDTGIGIDPEFLPYIFDRFRQADSTTTRKHGGLGLGLAIVRHLVELHGGTIEARSEGTGQGATFRISLPLAAEQPRTFRFQAARDYMFSLNQEHLMLGGLRVLVVDDEADARELISAMLERYGARVTAVSSCNEAIEVLSRWNPDVVVSDIGMPGEDGYALIRKVRSLKAECKAKIPAVALTAYASAEDRSRVLSAGYQMHVPKPVEPAELVGAIANLVARNAESS